MVLILRVDSVNLSGCNERLAVAMTVRVVACDFSTLCTQHLVLSTSTLTQPITDHGSADAVRDVGLTGSSNHPRRAEIS